LQHNWKKVYPTGRRHAFQNEGMVFAVITTIAA
jgi:hypothetical protein